MQRKRDNRNGDDELDDNDNNPQILQQWEQLNQGSNPDGDNEDLSSNIFDENTPSKKKQKVGNTNQQPGYGDSNISLAQKQQYAQSSVPISPFSATSDVRSQQINERSYNHHPPNKSDSLSTFVASLLDMMSTPAYSHAITWNKQGDAVIIVNEKKLASEVLPHYFKHSNIASFIRQLNMYGFHKGGGPDDLIFMNPNFIRGHPELVKNIRRRAAKDLRAKLLPSTVQVLDEVKAEATLSRAFEENSGSMGPPDHPHFKAKQILKDIKRLNEIQEQHAARLTELLARNAHLEYENNLLLTSLEATKKRQEYLESKLAATVLLLKNLYPFPPSHHKLAQQPQQNLLENIPSGQAAATASSSTSTSNNQQQQSSNIEPLNTQATNDIKPNIESAATPGSMSYDELDEFATKALKGDAISSEDVDINDTHHDSLLRLESFSSNIPDSELQNQYGSFADNVLDHLDDQHDAYSSIDSLHSEVVNSNGNGNVRNT